MASSFQSLTPRARAYVLCVVVAGFAIVTQSVTDLVTRPKDWSWTVLALLTLVSGSATIRLPSLPATISVSETFVFTSVLLFGPSAGTVTVALDALVISAWSYKKGHPLYKILFNICALPLTIWVAGHIFFLLAGIEPLSTTDQRAPSIREILLPLIAFTVLYFGLNSWIITFAISFETQLSPFKIWRENFVWLSLNFFGGASVAALMVSYTRNLDVTYLAIIVPLLLVLYFTFSTSMGRVADANRHLEQLNALYMSTIETLAMAIDAKDQITHGHIRRVQTYAVGLAKEVGITDEKQIKAIEAAALLHDMGKLAVPEYILNKPGPLTPTEFEKMKLHASVGADILSAIDFPYPVVPIVRHHHENWDGSGYPDGLSGAGIPIGARILSVVDCFDALTSDRPYRPRLSDKEALRILLERRGSMYDPLVVDTFMRVHSTIAPPESEPARTSLAVITVASAAAARSPRLEDIAASSGEAVTLLALAQALATTRGLRELGDLVLSHVRRLIPHSCGVLFVYEADSDDLSAVAVSGDLATLVLGLRIPLGQQLSGWVAANRQTIRNSDAILDLGEIARAAEPRLRTCLATAVKGTRNNLSGVITLYSSTPEAFSEEHERILEAVADRLAPAIERTTSHRKMAEYSASQTTQAGLSNIGIEKGACVVVLRTKTAESKARLHDVAARLSQLLSDADRLLNQDDDLVLLLHRADRNTAQKLLDDLVSEFKNLQEPLELEFAIACTPDDGASLSELLARSSSLHFNRSKSEKRSIH